VREKEHDYKNEARSERSGERCARTALFINERLRRTPADGETATSPAARFDAASARFFLIGIEPSAVLGDEHPADRGRFDRAEEKHARLVEVIRSKSFQWTAEL